MPHRNKNKQLAQQRRRERHNAERKRELARRAENAVLRKTKQVLEGESIAVGLAADGVKMSEVLREFVEPYYEGGATKEVYNKLLTLGVAAWNAALLPPDEREDFVDEVLEVVPPEVRAAMKLLIANMIARKEREFAWCRRSIIEFTLDDWGDEWHIKVASTL